MAPQVSDQERQARQDAVQRLMGFTRAIIASPECRAFMRTDGNLARDQEARRLLLLTE